MLSPSSLEAVNVKRLSDQELREYRDVIATLQDRLDDIAARFDCEAAGRMAHRRLDTGADNAD
jgi:hypothetical protein